MQPRGGGGGDVSSVPPLIADYPDRSWQHPPVSEILKPSYPILL